MVVLGVYPNETSDTVRRYANGIEANNPDADVDVLQFDNVEDCNSYLMQHVSFCKPVRFTS